MVLENAFITPYKKVIINKTLASGICKTCNVKNTERHILGWCKEINYDLIQRHDIVVDEVYKEIIKERLNDDYDYSRKFIQFAGGFLEKGKVIGSILKDKYLNNRSLKPDIVYVSISEVLIIDVNICLEGRMKSNYNEKYNKYLKLALEQKRLHNIKKFRIIPVIFNIYGIIYERSRSELERFQLKLDYNKLFREILVKEVNILIKQNN